MAKGDLVFILKRLLQTDTYLEFLLQLDEADLRTLIACIRDRIDRGKQCRKHIWGVKHSTRPYEYDVDTYVRLTDRNSHPV